MVPGLVCNVGMVGWWLVGGRGESQKLLGLWRSPPLLNKLLPSLSCHRLGEIGRECLLTALVPQMPQQLEFRQTQAQTSILCGWWGPNNVHMPAPWPPINRRVETSRDQELSSGTCMGHCGISATFFMARPDACLIITVPEYVF